MSAAAAAGPPPPMDTIVTFGDSLTQVRLISLLDPKVRQPADRRDPRPYEQTWEEGSLNQRLACEPVVACRRPRVVLLTERTR